MRRKLLLLGGFFLLLLAVFYVLLFAGTNYYKVSLPVLSYVKDFRFTDQNGKPVSERNVDGKVYVAEYFFTTCKGICPKMNANMKGIYDKFKKEDRFAIVSHTCMPETDSVCKLKMHEQKLLGIEDHSPNNNWYFVTGNKNDLYKMARESYLLDDEKNNNVNIDDQFIHTQFFALVDKQRRVRGIYDGLRQDELNKLSADIKELLKETPDARRGLISPFSNNPN